MCLRLRLSPNLVLIYTQERVRDRVCALKLRSSDVTSHLTESVVNHM